MLTDTDGKTLIKLAREAISLGFKGKQADLKKYSKYNAPRGVFVTLKKQGELRGCIGFPTHVYPLNEAVAKAALSAAFSDPRFLPLKESELTDIKIELSALTVPKELKVEKKEDYMKKINIGRDGLIVKNNFTSGLLLPQVAPDWNWGPLEFLENTCLKANLSKDAWKEEGVSVLSFQAQIFEEK
ncbi:TIGR00296 family protein [Candidatus Woesearchaeota archaeon]|nr:TIGR00296 family protein [Candidatus Woesearchaeota archaeon]